MDNQLDIADLGLSEEQKQDWFERLQRRLGPLWKTISAMSEEEQTIVVVPSMSMEFALHGSEMQSYEERFLFLMLLLRQPRARVVYVTSQSIPDEVIDYYLCLLPGVIISHARKRLFLVSPQDCDPIPLTTKLLQRPRLIEKIRSLIPDAERAHLVPFNTTVAERDLALCLGIPMYGCDPKFDFLGTKSGGRKLFSECGVPHPLGYEDVRTLGDVVEAIAKFRVERPTVSQVMLKHDSGVSGEGNSVVDLDGLSDDASGDEIEARVMGLTLELEELGVAAYFAKLERLGGIVEERIVGETLRSPSVQLRISPNRGVEVLSTHDQLLGGPSGQSYLGCCFPADDAYASTIAAEGAKIAERLADEGVIGRFAIDFLTAETSEGWKAYAIELNLRKGGTTHPFLTLQFLTGGRYDYRTNAFTTPSGARKYFVASDHVESPRFRVFTANDLFDIAVRHGLHFDQGRETGVVFHMMASVGDRGRFGLTAVGDSAADAYALYERTHAVLEEEAEAALRPRELPEL